MITFTSSYSIIDDRFFICFSIFLEFKFSHKLKLVKVKWNVINWNTHGNKISKNNPSERVLHKFLIKNRICACAYYTYFMQFHHTACSSYFFFVSSIALTSLSRE